MEIEELDSPNQINKYYEALVAKIRRIFDVVVSTIWKKHKENYDQHLLRNGQQTIRISDRFHIYSVFRSADCRSD